MLLKIALQYFLAVRQILDVSPRAEHLCPANFCVTLRVIREIRIVQLAIITQQEAAEIQRQV